MGVLAVADTANHMIRGLDTTRKTVFTIAGVGPSDPPDAGDGGPATLSGIFHPRGVAYDQDGNLFVSSERGLIRKIDTAGTISTFAGLPLEEGGILANEGLATTMALNKPLGLVVDNAKKLLYVAETGAQRVVRIDMVTKLASVVAGTGNCDLSQAGDGLPALQVSLCDPTYLGLDDGGNLIIVDSGHKKIRRVIFGSSSAGTLAFNPTNKDLSKLTRNNDGTWTRVYRNGTQVVFDSRGLQTSARDRVGNTSSLAYDSDGNLTTFVDSAGQTTTMSYSGGKLLSIQDPASRTTTFTYSGNLLTQISLPDGTSKTFNYDNNGQMTNETNQRGLTTKYEYNAYNRLGKVTDSDNKEVIVTDMVTQSMSNSYTGGATGQLVSSGFGPTKVNDKVVDARSVSTELAVNFQGAITKIKDGKGQVTTVDRNLDGDPVGVTYPDNSKVSFTYDPTTRDLLSRTDIGTGIVESKTYDYFGNILTQTDGNGRVTSKVYDPTSGILISEIAPGGIRVVYTYTTKGLLASRTVFPTGAIALTTQYEYDGRGNLSRSIAADGIQTQYVSDLAGNTTQVIKQTSAGTTAVTNYAYDLTNRLIRVITANGETTEYSYLPTGELSQIKDPKGKFQSFEYDRKGRLVKKTDTSGKVYTMSYDGNGNVVQQTDPNGNVKTYAYDEINKLITAQYPDDQITYQYSLKGDLTQITNRNSSVAYGYDTKGRTTYQKMVGVGTLSDYPQVDMISSYDGVGNRTSLATPLATFSYIYDSANRLNNISSTLGDSFNFGYDLANRLTQVGRPGSQTNFSYAASGVINSIIHSAGGTTKSFAQYQYDLRNYPIQKTTPAGTSNFSYDGNGQLLSATGVTGSENYNYDSIGNRLSDTTTSYGYDSNAQRLLDDGVYNYSYDENGNLISKIPKDSSQNAIIYGYSSKNQLVHIQITATALGAVIKDTKYTYDVLGRRIEKRVTDTTGPIAVKVRRYVYDGDSILFEYDESSLLATHTHSQLSADDVLGTTVTSAGAIAGVSTSPGHFYFLKDALGSLTDIINSSGTVIQKYEYSAFGKIRSITDATGVDITSSPLLNAAFTFTGRELDDESGLYYYRARYYDPQLGRFLQVDPHPGRIQNPASSNNRYSYALNNPTTYRDPSGKDIWDEFGKVATITAAVVAGVFAGGAAAAYLGVSGVLGALVGASAGSVVGGLIGALGFAVSHADPREGLRLGAIAGGLSGILGGSGLINVSVNVKTVSPTDVFNGILGRAENSGGIDVAKAAEAMANDPFLGGAAKLAISGLPYITPAIAHSILVSEDQCLAGGSCGGINVPVYDNGGHSF
jgi:RHS repeat-associated protein